MLLMRWAAAQQQCQQPTHSTDRRAPAGRIVRSLSPYQQDYTWSIHTPTHRRTSSATLTLRNRYVHDETGSRALVAGMLGHRIQSRQFCLGRVTCHFVGHATRPFCFQFANVHSLQQRQLSEMTYTVSGGALNCTQTKPYLLLCCLNGRLSAVQQYSKVSK